MPHTRCKGRSSCPGFLAVGWPSALDFAGRRQFDRGTRFTYTVGQNVAQSGQFHRAGHGASLPSGGRRRPHSVRMKQNHPEGAGRPAHSAPHVAEDEDRPECSTASRARLAPIALCTFTPDLGAQAGVLCLHDLNWLPAPSKRTSRFSELPLALYPLGRVGMTECTNLGKSSLGYRNSLYSIASALHP